MVGMPAAPDTAEHRRLADRDAGWKRWGPYVSERAWGTVREDYSEDGDAWGSFPHDHARSRVYRWNEDGLGGLSDAGQHLCFGLAFWNGQDPILKERIYGLTGNEGNHGEDAKEHWWYLDSTPTHSWMRWRYMYPQRAFPYDELLSENRRRSRLEPEFELLDTAIFDDDRYWEITADYGKSSPDDIGIRLTIRNAGSERATLHVLPTVWFRNTWSWGIDPTRPLLMADGGAIVAEHHELGRLVLRSDHASEPLFCDNETNTRRLWGAHDGPRYPKDGINDHVVAGADTVNPERTGTKASLHHVLDVAPGATAVVHLRLSAEGDADPAMVGDVLRAREVEADEFYAMLTPEDASTDEASVMRQAFAGMMWGKQLFHLDVERWLDGDPAGPSPPASRHEGRNHEWRHLNNRDVISMPDPWEYPWYAAWDLAFHCVAIAHIDPDFAKDQLLLLCREWYMHPNGQLPAYEWSFGDVNPPVHAWAALRVFEIDGSRDHAFLARVLHKLLLNFTWWVNRKDDDGNNVFSGGFLGLDNIGPLDRSAQLPEGGQLEQSDGTAWMAMYCLNLLEISLVLARHDRIYEDLATKFLEHFTYIAAAMNDQGLWDEDDGFYYDVLLVDGQRLPLRVHSMVGLIPLLATTTLGTATLDALPDFHRRLLWFLENKPYYALSIDHTNVLEGHRGRLLSIVAPDRLRRILDVMLDEDEFLSPYGVRALSRRHRDEPFSIQLAGMDATVDYEPGESTTALFGGNSNWRGPIWFPVNYLVIESLRRFARYLGDERTVQCPTRDGRSSTMAEVADELSRRLIGIFLEDRDGRRPVFGQYEKLQSDPAWHDLVPFHEYFHGDTGMGLGASHQTGWTGLVADLITSRRFRHA
jgi:hypothetical protein